MSRGHWRGCRRGDDRPHGRREYRCSSQNSQEIDEGEDADPDHVQEVPEHRQAHQAAAVGLDQAELPDLHHQGHQPDQAAADVQAVGADQVKKADRKALRCGVAPSWIMWANSDSSMPMKAAPNRPVIASQIWVCAILFCCIVSMAKP